METIIGIQGINLFATIPRIRCFLLNQVFQVYAEPEVERPSDESILKIDNTVNKILKTFIFIVQVETIIYRA